MSEYLEVFEKYSDELEIKYLIADKFEGSDYEGYIVVYIDDDGFSRKILVNLGFQKIESDLYYKKLEDFDKIEDDKIEEIKLYYSDKYSKNFKKNEYRKRTVKLKKIWDSIADKIYEINQLFFKNYGTEFFVPTLKTLDLSLKLTNIIVLNERSFGRFCYYLYLFGYESILEETRNELFKSLKTVYPEKCINKESYLKFFKEELLENDPFYDQIDKLRNYEIHLKEKLEPENLDVIKNFSPNKIKKLPTNKYEYFILQIKLLEDFYSFIEKMYDIIATKL